MSRSLRILTLVVFLVPVTGAQAWVNLDPCAEECAGEPATAEACGADCLLCACCPSGRSLLAATTAVAAPGEPARAVGAARATPPGAPDPREILHVPIRSFA